MDDFEEQLVALRDVVTRHTGALHEAQVLQLKAWPRVSFPAVRGLQFGWDWERRRLEYDFEVSEKASFPRAGLRRLARSVHFLLGEDVVMVIRVGQKVIYQDGEERVESTTKLRRRARRRSARRR